MPTPNHSSSPDLVAHTGCFVWPFGRSSARTAQNYHANTSANSTGSGRSESDSESQNQLKGVAIEGDQLASRIARKERRLDRVFSNSIH